MPADRQTWGQVSIAFDSSVAIEPEQVAIYPPKRDDGRCQPEQEKSGNGLQLDDNELSHDREDTDHQDDANLPEATLPGDHEFHRMGQLQRDDCTEQGIEDALKRRVGGAIHRAEKNLA